MKTEVKYRVIRNNQKEILAALEKASERAVMSAGFIVETDAKMRMGTSKSGRVYAKRSTYKRRVFKTTKDEEGNKTKTFTGQYKEFTRKSKHRASAPGEAPAIDTGNLVNSINTTLDNSDKKKVFAIVYTGVEYAPWLEFGTGRISPRPFFRPAVDENLDKIKKIMRETMSVAIQEAAK